MTPAAPRSYLAGAHISSGGSAQVRMEAAGLDFDGSALGDPPLPGAADLMAAALAACLSKNLERISRVLSFPYQRGRVTVGLEREDVPAEPFARPSWWR